MKLIKIFAHGFKSFADPITLTFDGGVTGIVGPNGSGKSNINDAVRWVLGESSSKQLRGDNMNDVIFAGSKTAPEMDRAEVTLTFDNKDRTIQNQGDTFTISRVIKRNVGGNLYFINGEEARLRDIKEIAMQTGISKSSLAIISQGTVSDIAEASPIQRRGIFEEAAGVSIYKSRKDEALRKLERTMIELEKVEDRVKTQEKLLNKLQKQAEKAKIWMDKTNQLKDVEIGLLVNNISHYSELLEKLDTELKGVDETKANLNKLLDEAEDVIRHKSTFKYDLEKELQELKNENDAINVKLRNIEIAKVRQAEQRKVIYGGLVDATPEQIIESLKEEIKEKNDDFLAFKNQLENIRTKAETFKKEAEELEKIRQELNAKFVTNERNRQVINATLISLREQYKSQNHLSQGTKTILDNKFLFKGLEGTVADLIKFDSKYHNAMSIILGQSVQNLVVDTPETAIKAINFLKNNKNGRATFIPLSSVSPKFVRQEHLYILEGMKGYIGIASDLAQADAKFGILVKFLLGNILVAETIEHANQIAELLDKRYTVVSLDGDIVRPGGVMQGGEKVKNTIFGIEEKIKELEAAIPKHDEYEKNVRSEMNKVQIQYENKMKIITGFTEEAFKIRQNIERTEVELTELNIKFRNLSNEELKLSNVLNIETNVEALKTKQIENTAHINAKQEQIADFAKEITKLTIEKMDFEKQLRNFETKFNDKIREKDRSQLYLKQASERLSEHYKMTFEVASEQYKLELEVDEATKIVKTLRREIDELGAVNLEALREYEEVKKEYDILTESYDEISEAKNKIDEAIAQLDKIIISRLTNVVDEVNKEINEVFSAMFGGGSANVKFSDPNNVLESGIEIEAQPPGKMIKNLKLFSGGEKSLIAISLLFAIIKSRPLPLCILDEVEAALDESNVVRYAEFLQKLKDTTQFLVVTHRHGTMANVDRLVGASMQKRGITSFFTVSIEDAKKMLEEAEEK
ncbi:ABC transporter ATP-binding protein [Mycoplasmopsis californica]|uniref:Chromosome partition protein Smc n=1 Tax=Mycoplasmopsis equigenitalium TaxID=114883 RepID=A0ABY5J2D0_9BACT|nr:AAA family ATPase [Mycoplasmopsis equigenitalium]UUD36879.1 AAA family ATPase [Mycoplasmopsis equigenitalium]VEU69826.1 ABC transporter ATP-binding protein [Mycoplasmopsis californica]